MTEIQPTPAPKLKLYCSLCNHEIGPALKLTSHWRLFHQREWERSERRLWIWRQHHGK